jgi:hypothetical protein
VPYRALVLQKSVPLTDGGKTPPQDILLPRNGIIMNSPIKTKVKTIDGLSIRYAESGPREKSGDSLKPLAGEPLGGKVVTNAVKNTARKAK